METSHYMYGRLHLSEEMVSAILYSSAVVWCHKEPILKLLCCFLVLYFCTFTCRISKILMKNLEKITLKFLPDSIKPLKVFTSTSLI